MKLSGIVEGVRFLKCTVPTCKCVLQRSSPLVLKQTCGGVLGAELFVLANIGNILNAH